jgi:hypothetical protein
MRRMGIAVPIIIVVLYFGQLRTVAQRGHGSSGGMGNTGPNSHSGMTTQPSNPSSRSSNSGSQKSADQLPNQKSVSDNLAHNTQLSSKLQGLLPSGTNLQQVSSGFKNMGQFVSAVHVSHNLNIPFDQLKARMTGDHSVSLGKAIHEFRPDVDAKAEAKKAEHQANEDLKES